MQLAECRLLHASTHLFVNNWGTKFGYDTNSFVSLRMSHICKLFIWRKVNFKLYQERLYFQLTLIQYFCKGVVIKKKSFNIRKNKHEDEWKGNAISVYVFKIFIWSLILLKKIIAQKTCFYINNFFTFVFFFIFFFYET